VLSKRHGRVAGTAGTPPPPPPSAYYRENKNANGVPRDEVHGILYFQNVIRFQVTHVDVISPTPKKKGVPSLPCRFSQKSQMLKTLC
jgi:hypothetical protein